MKQPQPRLNLDGLNREQIKQIQTMIDSFKQQNQRDECNNQTPENSYSELVKEILFESEILQSFNRALLYGERI